MSIPCYECIREYLVRFSLCFIVYLWPLINETRPHFTFVSSWFASSFPIRCRSIYFEIEIYWDSHILITQNIYPVRYVSNTRTWITLNVGKIRTKRRDIPTEFKLNEVHFKWRCVDTTIAMLSMTLLSSLNVSTNSSNFLCYFQRNLPSLN